jgi:hypothetical protein
VKVIGLTNPSEWDQDREYVCTVRHRELQQFLNLYYSRDEKMAILKVGETLDLGRGFDFAQQIARAMEQTQKFVEAHQTIVTAILNGLNIQQLVKAAEASKPAETAT